MKNRFKVAILLLSFILFFTVFYYALKSNSKNNPQVMVGAKLPAIELLSISDQGKKITLPTINKDKFYLINIWASWCVPCKEEHHFLMKLKNEKQIKIFGINYKDSKPNAVSFLEDLGNPFYYVGVDSDGKNSIEIGAYGIPETYIINSNGIIVFKHVGPINTVIYEAIVKILK